MSSVNLISGVISGSFSVPVPPQPAISVAMATALRKVSNFLIMVLNANLLIAIDHQAKRNDRDYFEFIGGLLITRIFAKIVIFFNFSTDFESSREYSKIVCIFITEKNNTLFIFNMNNIIQSYGTIDTGKVIRFTGCRPDEELQLYLDSKGCDARGDAGVTRTTDILVVPYIGFSSSKTSKIRPEAIIVDMASFKANPDKYL